jgi:hypothetical protein
LDGGRAEGRHDESGSAEALGRPGDCAQVADVRDAIDGHEEGWGAGFESARDEFVEGGVGDGGEEGDDALVGLAGDAVKFFARDARDGDSGVAEALEEDGGAFALFFSLEEDALEFFAGV